MHVLETSHAHEQKMRLEIAWYTEKCFLQRLCLAGVYKEKNASIWDWVCKMITLRRACKTRYLDSAIGPLRACEGSTKRQIKAVESRMGYTKRQLWGAERPTKQQLRRSGMGKTIFLSSAGVKRYSLAYITAEEEIAHTC